MVDVLLESKKKNPKYGCCPTGALKSLDMVDVLLASKKSPNMVVSLLAP